MEVYTDDILVKSEESHQHLSHLEETFQILDRFGMRLDIAKCSFVTFRKFLGHLVLRKGIKAYLSQVRAILNMYPFSSKKDIQRLVGWIVALSQFISHSFDNFKICFSQFQDKPISSYALIFFKLIYLQLALINLSHHSIIILSPFVSFSIKKTQPRRSPLPYLVVPNTAVSSVLDLEEDRKHYLIYYMNMVMLDAETRYTQLEQLALALIEIVKKLKLYFQSYTVIVLTSYPLKMYCIVLIHQKS